MNYKRKSQARPFTKVKLEAIRKSPYFLKKDEEVRKELATKEFKNLQKKYRIKNVKSLTTNAKSNKKTASKPKPKKLKRFSKAQLESIHNSPMVVRKNKAADEFFSSPGYKAIARDSTAKKKIKDVKKKHR